VFEEADPYLCAARPCERACSAQILDDTLEKLPTLRFEAGQLRPRLERPAHVVEFPLQADAIVSVEKPQNSAGAQRCVGPGCDLSHGLPLPISSASAGEVRTFPRLVKVLNLPPI
jgi:hypothetical protein